MNNNHPDLSKAARVTMGQRITRRSFMGKSIASIGALSVSPLPSMARMLDSTDTGLVLRFAAPSDGHYGQKPDLVASYEKACQDIVTWLNNENSDGGLDFAFFNGDIIMNNVSDLAVVRDTYFSNLSMPYYANYGNHERATEEQWQSTWGYARNHDFESGEYAFILANTSDEVGTMGCADASWLNGRLTYYAGKKYVFVFMHIAPAEGTSGCSDVKSIIAKHDNVAAVFSGHNHHIDSVRMSGGVPYCYSGRYGGEWGVPYMGYRICEVYENDAVITYQYNGTASKVVNNNQLHGPTTSARLSGITNGTTGRLCVFNSSLTDAVLIRYQTYGHAPVDLRISDVQGRMVRTFYARAPRAGEYEVAWDMRDGRGRRLAKGAYVVCCLEGGREAAREAIVIR